MTPGDVSVLATADQFLQGVLDDNTTRILNSIFDGVYITDHNRRILFWNQGAERLTGFTAEEVQGRCCYDNILNHIDADGNLLCNNRCPLLRTIETGEPSRGKVYPLRKDKKRFATTTHVGAIKDPSGRTVAGIEVFRDITAEEKYRKLQEKFKALIRKYVSKRTYDEIVDQVSSGRANTARSCEMTVLFLDIADFTSFSEHHTPQEVSELLNDVFGICEVITTEAHGDIDKFIGDAVMATFVDPDDALNAARKMLGALEKLNVVRSRVEKDPVQVRIGINTGHVILGEVGTKARKDRTVLGDPVNVASRLQESGGLDAITISDSTYHRLSDTSGLQPHGSVAVRGKEQSVTVYQYRPVEPR